MFLLLKANLCDKIWCNMFFFWKYWAFGCWKTFRLSFPNKNMFPEIKVIFLNIFSGGQTPKKTSPSDTVHDPRLETSWKRFHDMLINDSNDKFGMFFFGSYKNIYCMQNLMLWICDWCWGTLIQDPNRLSLWLLDGLQRLKKMCLIWSVEACCDMNLGWWYLCNMKQTKCYANVCAKQNLPVWMEYPMQRAKIILAMADTIHHLGCTRLRNSSCDEVPILWCRILHPSICSLKLMANK